MKQEILKRNQDECYTNVCSRKENERLKKQNEKLQRKVNEICEQIRSSGQTINDLKRMYDNSGCGSSTTNVTTEQCHDFGLGWEPFLRSCYHVGTNAVTWSNAVKTCNSMGSVLTVITTAEENDFVIRLVKRKGVSSSEGYWLDGTDSLFEGLWIWSSTGILITYQNWGVNEPNNKDSTENCLELKTKKNYTWNDEKCNISKRQYICERTL